MSKDRTTKSDILFYVFITAFYLGMAYLFLFLPIKAGINYFVDKRQDRLRVEKLENLYPITGATDIELLIDTVVTANLNCNDSYSGRDFESDLTYLLGSYKSGKAAIIEPRAFYIEADTEHRFIKVGSPNSCTAFIPEDFSQAKVGDSLILEGRCERRDSAENIINSTYPKDDANVMIGYDDFSTIEDGETYITRIYSASCELEVLEVSDCLDQELTERNLIVQYQVNDRDRGINFYLKDRGKTYLCSNTELDNFRQEIKKKWSEGK